MYPSARPTGAIWAFRGEARYNTLPSSYLACIFDLFADALHWIIQCHIPASLQHYLDNFLSVFAPDTKPRLARAAVGWIMSLGTTLGLRFQPDKTVWPATCIKLFGLEFDSVAMVACLQPDKLAALHIHLAEWHITSTGSLRELQLLTGRLQFAAKVIPYAHAFIRRLLLLLCNIPLASHLPHDPSLGSGRSLLVVAIRHCLEWRTRPDTQPPDYSQSILMPVSMSLS